MDQIELVLNGRKMEGMVDMAESGSKSRSWVSLEHAQQCFADVVHKLSSSHGIDIVVAVHDSCSGNTLIKVNLTEAMLENSDTVTISFNPGKRPEGQKQ